MYGPPPNCKRFEVGEGQSAKMYPASPQKLPFRETGV
jgi:hypothetical protein